MLEALTIKILTDEATVFAIAESKHAEPSLYGVNDGKAVGTYLEHKFVAHLMDRYSFASGNSAKGIDIPSINVDIKVTSARQPQSSSPFRSARQKVYGLGYHLIIFVYEKDDIDIDRTSSLNIVKLIFVDESRTGDYQMTRGLREILQRDGNRDDIIAFLSERNLPIDEIEAGNLADQIMAETPQEGYLTISNALQWRLQYGRALQLAGQIDGIQRLV